MMFHTAGTAAVPGKYTDVRNAAQGWLPNVVAGRARRRSTGASTVIVMVASRLSTLLGFVRQMVTAHYYSTRAELQRTL